MKTLMTNAELTSVAPDKEIAGSEVTKGHVVQWVTE